MLIHAAVAITDGECLLVARERWGALYCNRGSVFARNWRSSSKCDERCDEDDSETSSSEEAHNRRTSRFRRTDTQGIRLYSADVPVCVAIYSITRHIPYLAGL